MAAPAARAAESDPYWGWRSPPRESARAIDGAINRLLVRGLADVNAARITSCREAVALFTAPLKVTSEHFFRSAMRPWTMDRSPSDDRQREAFDDASVYRRAPLFPLGHFVPLDPTLQADGVLFGPDKIGHFFTNGLRSYHRFLAARAAGADVDAAELAAVRYGVDEENGWLGLGIDGVFSFADLHASLAGVRFYRALCEGDELTRADDGRWTFSPLFAMARWIDPCWDESFNPSAFAPSEADAVSGALLEVCPLLDDAVVQTRRQRYRTRGCHEGTSAVLDALILDGVAPSPVRWDIERACARQR